MAESGKSLIREGHELTNDWWQPTNFAGSCIDTNQLRFTLASRLAE